MTGNTINIMTLGGLALAIGMLVDEATVSIENIHVQMMQTKSLARAVQRGSQETAVPRLLAMLCILSVFIPAFMMAEPVRSLFVPLSLAVGFAMITSYLLSSTLVPVLATWLLRHHGGHEQEVDQAKSPAAPGDGEGGPAFRHEEGKPGAFFNRFRAAFGWVVEGGVRRCGLVVPAYLGVCALLLTVLFLLLGRELFPVVDQGQFVLAHMPPGTNFELTRKAWLECLNVIEDEVGAGNVHISMGFAGQQGTDYAVNNMILFMTGPGDGQIRVALDKSSGVSVPKLRAATAQRAAQTPEAVVCPHAAETRLFRRASPGSRRPHEVRFRAGRHHQRGDDLRLAHADRGRRLRERSAPVAGVREQGPG